MDDRKLTGEESINLIQQMIKMARDVHRESGEGWLIWGWLLFAASILSIVFIKMNISGYISWIWMIMLGLGLVVYVFGHVRKQKNSQVRTYIQELLDKLEMGFFISLFALIAAGQITGTSANSFGYFFILYAFWMFIHGTAIRFRPLLIGAYVNWAAAIAIFLVTAFSNKMIISAVAVLIGYLVPGYLLRAEYKRNYSSQEKVNDGV